MLQCSYHLMPRHSREGQPLLIAIFFMTSGDPSSYLWLNLAQPSIVNISLHAFSQQKFVEKQKCTKGGFVLERLPKCYDSSVYIVIITV